MNDFDRLYFQEETIKSLYYYYDANAFEIKKKYLFA